MSELDDRIAAYLAARREYRKAAGEVERLVALVAKAAEKLKGWRNTKDGELD
jgi:hypothetical protein